MWTSVGIVTSGLIGLTLFGIPGSILAPILVGGAIRGVDNNKTSEEQAL
jgi:predicted PurR-regulated permease PerM